MFGFRTSKRTATPTANATRQPIADTAPAASEDTQAAIAACRRAIAANPGDKDNHAALADLLRESGDVRAALDVLEPIAVAHPDDDNLQTQFIETLIAANEHEWARRHADYADLRKPGRAFRQYVDAALASPDESAQTTDAASSSSHDDVFAVGGDPLFSNDHALRMATLFQGRADTFARQWVSEEGQTGYAPVYKPYTPRVVLNHLLGNYTTGIYLTRADGTARVLAFDLDIVADAIQSARGNATRAAELRTAVTSYACLLAATLRSLGLAPVIEDSGYKGAHVWVCFDDWAPSGQLRCLGNCILNHVGEHPDTVAIEVFPKQKGSPAKLGNLIKLPLGVHRKTGRRSLLLDDKGSPASNQAAALMAIRPSSVALVSKLLDKLNLPPDPFTRRPAPGPGSPNNPGSPDVFLRALAGSRTAPADPPVISDAEFDANPVLVHLVQRCSVLAGLIRRIRTTRRISYDEKLIIEHTLGHLPDGPALVNYLLRPCENFDTQFLMGRRHRGCPTSCSKIAARIPHIMLSSSCNCSFADACANYATPLNHLYSYIPATMPVALPAPERAAAATTAFEVAALLKRIQSISSSPQDKP